MRKQTVGLKAKILPNTSLPRLSDEAAEWSGPMALHFSAARRRIEHLACENGALRRERDELGWRAAVCSVWDVVRRSSKSTAPRLTRRVTLSPRMVRPS